MKTLIDVVKFEKAPYIKNLFYTDKKGYYYVIAKNETVVEKTFWKGINLKPKDMRFAKLEDLLGILSC